MPGAGLLTDQDKQALLAAAMQNKGAAGSAPVDLRGMAAQYQNTPGFQPVPQPAAEPAPLGLMPPIATPAPPLVPVTHDVTVVSTRKLRSAKVLGVPPEEFGIERGARDIKTSNYCFHDVVTKTEAQLIAEGFDADCIMALGDYTGLTNIETQERDTVSEHLSGNTGGQITSGRLVKITEHYIRMDFEGTGRPQLYQVITGGDQGEVLTKDGKDCITPFDAMPFAATTPVPQTHRFFGRSIADLVMPIQREKTALKRGVLDGLYLRLNPRVEVAEENAGSNTLDDLLVSRPGGVIRTKRAGGVNWQVVPDVSGSVFPMVQYLDSELESRTGLSKQSQGIDANALQNQSATAVEKVFSASQMRMKLIARITAEGVRDIFSLLHGTIRKHGQEKQTVQLRKKWVDIDPRGWKTRNDMTINVGLGTGGKAQQFAQTMAIGNVQKEMIAGGMTNLVGPTQLYNTATELTRIMGHKSPDRFFKDPDAKNPDGTPANPAPEPKADPKVEAINAKAAVDKQAAETRAALDQQKAAHQAQLDQQAAQNDAIHQQVKAQAAAELAKVKAEIETKLKMIDAHFKAAELAQKAQHAQETHHAHLEREGDKHHMTLASGALDMTIRAHDHHHNMREREAQPSNGDTET
jgi:hypothetical protein